MSDEPREPMKEESKRTIGTLGRTAIVAGAFTLALFLLASAGAGTTSASSGHLSLAVSGGTSGDYTLATVPGINSIAVSPSQMFVVGANCTQVWAVSPGGTLSLYATLPIPVKKCGEGSVALAPPHWGQTGSYGWGSGGGSSSPALGTWTGTGTYGGGYGDHHQPGGQGGNGGNWGNGGNGGCGCNGQKHNDSLWDVQEGQLFEITNGGSTVTLFATFANAGKDMGLTYDQVGNFSHDLIVTGSSGRVWTVNQTAVVTLIANLNTHIEGPAVAPWSFGAFGGDVLVGSTPKNAVFAVSPTGVVSKVAKWKQAESVAFPSNCDCGFGSTPAIFFVANVSSGAIEAYPASYFSSLSGLGFVDGEINGGIGSFTSTGVTTTLQSHTGHLEMIAFVQCFGREQGCGGCGGCGGNGGGCGGNGGGCGGNGGGCGGNGGGCGGNGGNGGGGGWGGNGGGGGNW